MSASRSLDELGRYYQTDKASGRHNYLSAYECVLASRRDRVRTLLEIEVKTGASLRMWRDYFLSAEIVGIDLNPACKQHVGDRIAIEIGSQDDDKFLERVTAGRKIDVVVDDGSHQWSHQIKSFLHLWPKLQPEGIYIVEDLHTSLASQVGKYGRPGTETGASFFARVARIVAASGYGPDEDTSPVVDAIRKTIEHIQFGSRYCCIVKRS